MSLTNYLILYIYSSKTVNYATEIIEEGDQKEIDRLFKYYPELEKENQKILNDLNISALNDIYY